MDVSELEENLFAASDAKVHICSLIIYVSIINSFSKILVG